MKFLRSKLFSSPLLTFWYWLFSVLLWEICLHLISYGMFTGYSWYVIPFGLIFALCLTLLCRLLPEKANRILTLVLSVALFLFYASQLVFNQVFGTFYSVSMVKLGGDAVTNFWKQTLLTIASSWWLLLIMLLPVVLAVLRGKKYPGSYARRKWLRSLALVLVIALLWAGTELSLRLGGTGYYTVYDYYHSNQTQTEQSVNFFGVAATMRLEIGHQLFSSNEGDSALLEDDIALEELIDETLPLETEVRDVAAETQSPDPAQSTEPAQPEEPTYGPNYLPIDFDKLSTLTEDKDILELNEYFSRARGSDKNEYTGMFKGYNLIEICAESYSPVFVDPELTPALYRLTTEGIVFHNYYTSYPNTTTNCEYSLCTGLFPDLGRDKYDASFVYSAENFVPFCLGNEFRSLGYHTLAFHNYVGSYFGRDKSHPNMGYDCYFANAGMRFTTDWPASDLEMMEQSLEYVYEAGEPFVAYYMTFSGHYRYDFYSNPMCIRNQSAVASMDYPEAVRAYIACNLELEYALEYLMDSLEEHGMLDHTVIVMTGDHYPYGLSEWQYEQMMDHEIETPFDKMKNSFICWAPNMETPIQCDNYCCNIDILPTVLNLFGVEYDSRLLAGTDALSDGDHIAILTDESFLTEYMMFDSSTNKVTKLVPDSQIPRRYFDRMVQLIKRKLLISSKILYTDYYDFVFHTGGMSLGNEAERVPVVEENPE